MLLDWLPNRTEKRATFKDTEGWLVGWWRGGRKTVSGEAVGPNTAMTIPAYYAAVHNIAEDVSKMPFDVIERAPGSKKRKKLREHPAYIAMNVQPNPEMTPMSFRENLIQHAFNWGNGTAEIVWNRGGTRMEMWPLDPSVVKIKRTEDGRLFYDVGTKRGRPVELRPDQVFHIHGFGYDGVTGYSVPRIAREVLGLGIAQIKSGAALFGNSAIPSGVLQFPGTLNKKLKSSIREGWEGNYGGASDQRRTAILDRGVTFSPISISMKDSQWIEARSFSVEDFCRITRCPPSKVQHLLKANFNTLDMQNLEWLMDTLLSWMIRIEQEARIKLIGIKHTDVYAKHNANAVLRGDQKSRFEAYRVGKQWGWLSSNDILEKEDQDGIGPQGDVYWVPMNMGDASKINEKKPKPEPKPVAPNPTDGTTDGDGNDEDLDAGKRAAILDRAHDVAASAIDAKDVICKIVWAHAPAMEGVLANMARVVDKCKDSSKRTKDFRTERIDHTSRCLGDVIAPCLNTAWAMICEPAEPDARATMDAAATEFATTVATRHVDALLEGEVNIPATVTAESGRLCKFLEGMICVDA